MEVTAAGSDGEDGHDKGENRGRESVDSPLVADD
jgi:hypothetical protein